MTGLSELIKGSPNIAAIYGLIQIFFTCRRTQTLSATSDKLRQFRWRL